LKFLTSISDQIYCNKRSYGLDIQREIRRGEDSLHPQTEGWSIRDPLRSRCNKKEYIFRLKDKKQYRF